MIGACSEAIRKYCKRDFHLRAYDELYGNWSGELLLRAYPIQSIESVRYAPSTVMRVQNTLTSTNQQARVTITQDGLTLLRTASGVRVLDTSLTWSSYVTITALVAGVNALGVGWSAEAVSGMGLWPSADLYVRPSFGDSVRSEGAIDCRGRWAELRMHTSELADYGWDPRGFLYRRDDGLWSYTPSGWQEESFGCVSRDYWRVQYTAGYQEIPEDIQEACAQWVATLWKRTARDPQATAVSSSAFEGSSSYTNTVAQQTAPPPEIKSLLDPYRRRGV